MGVLRNTSYAESIKKIHIARQKTSSTGFIGISDTCFQICRPIIIDTANPTMIHEVNS